MASRWAHRQPFRAVADDNLINDAGRVCFKVDHADSVDLTVLAAADVVDDRELAVGRDLDVERVKAGRHVVIFAVHLGVSDLLAVDIEQPHPVGTTLDDKRVLAVGGDGDSNG